MLAVGPAGLSDCDPAQVGDAVLACWDAFLDVASDPRTDLTRPSRLPGWTGLDTCIHLGSWPDSAPLAGLLASAAAGGAGEPGSPDAGNARLVAAHRGEGADAVLAALVRARDALGDFFDGPQPAQVARDIACSAVGPLPVLSLVHAATYELAVHAFDLAPCGAPAPDPVLPERGLAALIDVTGALAAAAGVHGEVTAQGPDYGWQFSADAAGWTVRRTDALHGCGVRASVRDLLDASAGRASVPQLLLTRRMSVQEPQAFLRLAPLAQQVPGLPGGAALRGLAGGLGRVGRLLGRRG